MSGKIKLAIAGVGNCASSLARGIEYYKHIGAQDCIGLMHYGGSEDGTGSGRCGTAHAQISRG